MPGFESPNYTQAPNELFDEMLKDMGYAELKVTLVAIRKTLGFHKESFRLSVSKMAQLTGLSEPSVLEGAKLAEARGTLTRIQDGGVTEWVVNLLYQPVKILNQSVKKVNRTGKAALPPSSKETLKENTLEKTNGADKPRPKDLLFDAICDVCGIDPATAGSSVGKVKSSLMKSTPPYTHEDVFEFRKLWWADKFRKERGIRPTIWQLKERIGIVRASRSSKDDTHTRPPAKVYT